MTTVDLDGLRLAVFVGGLSSMVLLEVRMPSRQWHASLPRRLLFHGFVATGNTLALRLLTSGPALLWASYVREQGLGLLPWLGLAGPAEVLASLVLLDYLDYWWHRWNHRIAFLWRFHKVHHIDTHVDASTSLRFHIGELLISTGVKGVWLVAIGPSVWAFALFESALSLASQFHHSNIDLPERVERRLRRVLVTPRFHASHHTVARETGDNNFGTIFIWWDRLSGTFRSPDEADLQYLGLPEGRETDLDLWALLLAPMREGATASAPAPPHPHPRNPS